MHKIISFVFVVFASTPIFSDAPSNSAPKFQLANILEGLEAMVALSDQQKLPGGLVTSKNAIKILKENKAFGVESVRMKVIYFER